MFLLWIIYYYWSMDILYYNLNSINTIKSITFLLVLLFPGENYPLLGKTYPTVSLCIVGVHEPSGAWVWRTCCILGTYTVCLPCAEANACWGSAWVQSSCRIRGRRAAFPRCVHACVSTGGVSWETSFHTHHSYEVAVWRLTTLACPFHVDGVAVASLLDFWLLL